MAEEGRVLKHTVLLAGLVGNISNLPRILHPILWPSQQYWLPPGLSTEMAIHMRGLAVHLYRQIPRLLGAKPPGRIGPDMPGSLTAQTPARVYAQIPARTPACLNGQMAG